MCQKNYKSVIIVIAVLILGVCAILYQHSLVEPKDDAKVMKKSSHAPENLPLETVKLGDLKNQGKLAITIDHNAAVELIPASDEQLSIEYAKELYDVSMKQQEDVWNIHIAYRGEYSKYPCAVLHIPSMQYDEVSLQANEATVYLQQVFPDCMNLKAEMKDATTFYELPYNLRGEVNMAVSSGYLELSSADEYRNSNITIRNISSKGEISDKFQEDDHQLKYAQGTKAGFVSIDFQNSGYLIIKE